MVKKQSMELCSKMEKDQYETMYCAFQNAYIIANTSRSFSDLPALIYLQVPIPVAVRSRAWVCGRSLTGIVGSNPTGGM